MAVSQAPVVTLVYHAQEKCPQGLSDYLNGSMQLALLPLRRRSGCEPSVDCSVESSHNPFTGSGDSLEDFSPHFVRLGTAPPLSALPRRHIDDFALNDRNWPGAGAAIIDIGATLLTPSLPMSTSGMERVAWIALCLESVWSSQW